MSVNTFLNRYKPDKSAYEGSEGKSTSSGSNFVLLRRWDGQQTSD